VGVGGEATLRRSRPEQIGCTGEICRGESAALGAARVERECRRTERDAARRSGRARGRGGGGAGQSAGLEAVMNPKMSMVEGEQRNPKRLPK
jgi:hypothetical protein